MRKLGFSRSATLLIGFVGGLTLLAVIGLAAYLILTRMPHPAAAAVRSVSWSGLPPTAVTNPAWQNATSTRIINDIARVDRLLWAATDGGVVVWDLDSGESSLFTTEHGLPGNRINAIAAAPNGTIWVAASGGIARHDGSGWQNFTSDKNLSPAEANDILTTPDGTVWAATNAGLARYDGRQWRTITTSSLLSGLPSDTVTALAPATGSAIWVGTDSGIVRTDGRSWSHYDVTTGLNSNLISALGAAADGTIWAATPVGINQFDGRSWRSFLLPAPFTGQGITALAPLPDGTIWLGFGAQLPGIAQFDGSSIVRTLTDANGLMGSGVTALLHDGSGSLWAATDSAVNQFDGSDWQTWQTPSTLPDNQIEDLLLAPSGLWAATPRGIARYDGSWRTFGTEAGLLDAQVSTLALGPQGAIWAGHANPLLGLSAEQPDGRFVPIECRLTTPPSRTITAGAIAPDGTRWLTTNNGLARTDGSSWTHFTTADGLPSNALSDIAITPDGVVWLGSDAGLSQFRETEAIAITTAPVTSLAATADNGLFLLSNGEIIRVSAEGQLTPLPPLPSDTAVRDLVASMNDELWLATDLGAARATAGGWQFFTPAEGLDSINVTAISQDASGRIWAATSNDTQQLDLRWFDGSRFQPHPNRATAAQRLSNNQVRDILATPDGALWFATADGIDWLQNGQWRRFTKEDGLPSNLVLAMVYAQDKVWALTDLGLAEFSTDNGIGFIPFGGAHGQGISDLRSITVAPDDALWITTQAFNDGIRVFDGYAWRIVPTLGNHSTFHAAALDANGRYWVAGHNDDRGVPFFGAYDPAGNSWTWQVTGTATPAIRTLAFAPDGLLWVGLADGQGIELRDVSSGAMDQVVARFAEPALPEKIHFGADGIVYVGSGDQLFEWDGSRWSHGEVPLPFMNETWDIESSAETGIWIASSQGAAHRTTAGWESFYAPVTTPGWWGSISEIVVRPDGAIAVGTAVGGVGLYTGRGYLIGRPEAWRGQAWPVTMLFNTSSGELWVGTEGAGLAILEGERWRTLAPEPAVTAGLTSLGFTPDGAAWLGTEAGLVSAVFTAATGPCDLIPFDETAATDVVRTRDGALWFGSENGGAVEINGLNQPPTATWPDSPVSLITQAPDGSLWAVNTRQNWLNYREPGSETWQRIALRQDLVTTADITSMAVDGQRTVWLGTARGVFVFNGREWSHLTSAEGLADNQIDAIQTTPDGAIWFATPGGLGRYSPK